MFGKSSFHEEKSSNLKSTKDLGISLIKDVGLELIVYLAIGYMLSSFMGNFLSGVHTFVLIFYWKNIRQREGTPLLEFP